MMYGYLMEIKIQKVVTYYITHLLYIICLCVSILKACMRKEKFQNLSKAYSEIVEFLISIFPGSTPKKKEFQKGTLNFSWFNASKKSFFVLFLLCQKKRIKKDKTPKKECPSQKRTYPISARWYVLKFFSSY